MISFSWLAVSPFGKALGWMIIHSLWQITVVALVLSILLRFISRKHSNVRYAVLLAGLVGIVGWSGFTYFSSLKIYKLPTSETSVTTLVATEEIGNPERWMPVIQSQYSQWMVWLDDHMRVITLIWLIGVILSCIYLIAGLSYLNYLQRHRVKPPTTELQERFGQLCQQMGIGRKVKLLLSEVVKDPITFQLWRPVILLPVSLATGLNAKQIELLILHELAHIRRYDFAVNILQTLVEIVFFYHPALWWISRNIRATREHCCDDAVLAIQNHPVLYAEVLTQIPYSNLSLKKRLAMSANNSQGTLSKRIFRLFGEYERQPPIYRSIFMALLLLFLSLGSQAFLIVEDPVPTDASETVSTVEEVAVAPPIVEGKVVDENDQPLIGVNVIVKGTRTGTITDFDGNFRLELPQNCVTLIFSYVGKQTKEQANSCGGQNLLIELEQKPTTTASPQVQEKKEEAQLVQEEEKKTPIIIEGHVKDEQAQPLIGTSILIKGTKTGTVADLEGHFRLALPSDCATLVFSYVGKQPQEVSDVCKGQKLDIILSEAQETEETSPPPMKKFEFPVLEISPEPNNLFSEMIVSPNPSSGPVNVGFKLAKAAKVFMTVFTIDGKPQFITIPNLEAGTHQLKWTNSTSLKGTFYIQLEAEGAKLSKQVVIE